MDKVAEKILEDYIKEHGIDREKIPYTIYISWKCKTIQNYKYLLCTSLPDNKYYELTLNGDLHEWYLDVYVKVHKETIDNRKYCFDSSKYKNNA